MLKLCTAVKAAGHIRNIIRDVRYVLKLCTAVKATAHIRNACYCSEFERYLFLSVAVQYLPERACTITNGVSFYVWRRKTGYLDVIDTIGFRLCGGKMVMQVSVCDRRIYYRLKRYVYCCVCCNLYLCGCIPLLSAGLYCTAGNCPRINSISGICSRGKGNFGAVINPFGRN